jgi:hypothetical protein
MLIPNEDETIPPCWIQAGQVLQTIRVSGCQVLRLAKPCAHSMKTLDKLPIKIDCEMIAAFCREHILQKMSLFGSVVRDNFDP